jgi:hypothetical protein
MKTGKRGTWLTSPSNGCYQHVPVLSYPERTRFAVAFAATPKVAAAKTKSQEQVYDKLRKRGYVATDSLQHLAHKGRAKVMRQGGAKEFVVITPNGSLQWYTGRPRAEYSGGWFSAKVKEEERMFAEAAKAKMISGLRRRGVQTSEVMTYIVMGHQKVHGCDDVHFNPYAGMTERRTANAMVRDTKAVVAWFDSNKSTWSDQELLDAQQSVRDIQRGPAHWWHTKLVNELLPIELEAVQSWAEREHQAPGSVDMESEGWPSMVRERLTYVTKVTDVGILRKILQFAFYGPVRQGQKWDSVQGVEEESELNL